MLTTILQEAQEKIENTFPEKLWVHHTRIGEPEYFLYYGTIQEVKELYYLCKNSYVFTEKFNPIPYNLVNHGVLEPINAVEEFAKLFVPHTIGDLIEYKGIIYKVERFTPNGDFYLQSKNMEEPIFILEKNEDYKMIYSRKSGYHIKDRLRRLF